MEHKKGFKLVSNESQVNLFFLSLLFSESIDSAFYTLHITCCKY
jgi:hypothetical protein